jgi:hypothetical protein
MIMAYVGWPKRFGAAGWAVVLVAAPAFLLLLAHAVSVMVRARTAWLVLDLTGVVMAATTAWLALRPLVAGGFDRAVEVVGVGVVAGVLTGLLVAGLIGLAEGRTDLPRTHRFLSTTLWGVLIVTVGGLLGYSTWLTSFGPDDFEYVGVGYVSPDGQWVEVEGSAKGHLDVKRSFLVSADGKRDFPIPGILESHEWLQTFVRVSEDGSRAVWVKPSADGKLGTLWWMDLKGADLEPVGTTITLPGDPRLEISPDGSTIAFLEERTLSVFDLEEERLVTAVRLEDEARHLLFHYTTSTNLRLLMFSYQEVDDYEWDRYLTYSDLPIERGAKPKERNTIHEPHGQRVLFDWGLGYVVPGFEGSGYLSRALYSPQKVFDAASGELVKVVQGRFGGFLPEGWFWSLDVSANGMATLVVESLRGNGRSSSIDLGARPESIVVAGDIGSLVFIARDDGYHGRSPRATWEDIEILDLETGEHRPVGRDLDIVGLRETYVGLPGGGRTSFYSTWSSATLFRDESGALLAWDPVGRDFTTIVGGPPS